MDWLWQQGLNGGSGEVSSEREGGSGEGTRGAGCGVEDRAGGAALVMIDPREVAIVKPMRLLNPAAPTGV